MRKLSVPAVTLFVVAIAVFYACRKELSHDPENIAAAPVTGNIDTNEFAPGHPDVKINAVEQLRSYPLPRFKKGHTLLPNIQWMSPYYFGGRGQPGIKKEQVLENSVKVQYELASNWNYYLMLPGNTEGHPYTYRDANSVPGAWVKLANEHPELPASVIIFWAQLRPNVAGFASRTPYVSSKYLPSSYYIAGHKRISPAAPLDSFKQDGLTQRYYLEKLTKALKRPIQLINENGEVFPPYDTKLLKNDPNAVKDKEKLGIKNWEEYKAYGRARITKAYRDQFMSLPALENTVYTEYGIDGHLTYRDKYSELRKVNSLINNQYYATPDFYPRWPSNWEVWKGPWHGIKWITDSRYYEIAAGDELFSPFVAAGWDINEEKNIRPAQWLGLLKALGVLGAEFHYTGFFSLKAPFPKPEHYAWQAVMPVYSQAITSQYEHILRNGELLNSPSYRFSTGNRNQLVFVRKHKLLPLYVITGSVQPFSNKPGDAPLEAETTIRLEGQAIRFISRRQGSTYIYDLRNANAPVFYQLDGWHEASHPSRWKREFLLEAELADLSAAGSFIRTERYGNDAGDFTRFTSFTGFSSEHDTLTFAFEPREGWPRAYYIWIRARVKDRSSRLSVSVDNEKAQSENVKDKSWKWYRVSAGKKETFSFAPGQHLLKLSSLNNMLELDKILVTPDEKEPGNDR